LIATANIIAASFLGFTMSRLLVLRSTPDAATTVAAGEITEYAPPFRSP
jgi:hypothetical protein